MEVDLGPPSNPVGEGTGYDFEEDLMREDLELEGCTPRKHRRQGGKGVRKQVV